MSCVFSIFDAGGMYVCVCVYAHRHTHTAHDFLDVSSGVGMRRLEGRKTLESRWTINLGLYVFVHVYKVHICLHMLGGEMRSGLTSFFLQHKKHCQALLTTPTMALVCGACQVVARRLFCIFLLMFLVLPTHQHHLCLYCTPT